MWKINTNLDGGKDMNIRSQDYDERLAGRLTHPFRLLDGDRVVYFEGVSDDRGSQRAFDPLDDFGEGYAGCAFIEYLENGKWEQL